MADASQGGGCVGVSQEGRRGGANAARVGSKRKARAGKAALLGPRKRQSTGKDTEFADAVSAATDTASSLRVRMTHAVKLRRMARHMDPRKAMDMVEHEMEVVGKLANALQHTAYFPLQELFFVSLSRLLRMISNDPDANKVLESVEMYLHSDYPGLLNALPLKRIIASEAADHARRELNAMNRRLHTCRTFNLLTCWISTKGKESLELLDADQWIDFGDTTASLYHRVARATEVVNIPYSSIQKAEIDEQKSTVLLHSAKKSSTSSGTTFIKLCIALGDFALLVNVLSVVAREGSITYHTLVKDGVSPTTSAPRTPQCIKAKVYCHEVSPLVTRKLFSSPSLHHQEARKQDTSLTGSTRSLNSLCKETHQPSIVVTPAKNDEARGSSPPDRPTRQKQRTLASVASDETCNDCDGEDQLTFERLGVMLDRRLEEVRESIIGDLPRAPLQVCSMSGICDAAGPSCAPSVQSIPKATVDSSAEPAIPIGNTRPCDSDAGNTAKPLRPHHVAMLSFVGLMWLMWVALLGNKRLMVPRT